MAIDIEELLNIMLMLKKATALSPLTSVITSKPQSVNQKVEEFKPDFELDDDGEEYMPVGTQGLLAASEKLLAINKGLVEPDERDSMLFQKIIRPAGMFRERIKMDSGKLARQAMYQASRRRNLSGLTPGFFSPYIDSVIKGNPLTSPLEEINPMLLVENARRITKMGPGGIPSADSITVEALSVNPSLFGYICTISGPECFVDNDLYKTNVLTSTGWKRIKDITADDLLACQINGNLTFNKPEKVIHQAYQGAIYKLNSNTIKFAVTPTHRFLCASGPKYKFKFLQAKDIYKKVRYIPCNPGVYDGVTKNKVTIGDKTYDAKDWCMFLGWFLSEGSIKGKLLQHPTICLSQSEDVHPYEYKLIVDLCKRMQIKFTESLASPYKQKKNNYKGHTDIHITEKGILEYIKERWMDGCYNKYIPEEIFNWGVNERLALLNTLLMGDGRVNKSHTCYCTVCKKLAKDVERLAISLGYCTRIRIEQDKRQHVKTTNYCVCLLKSLFRTTDTTIKNKESYWTKIDNYSGMVHCATVPGGCLYVQVNNCPGFWSGNSERAGIDVRAAHGTKIGTNGRIYQKMFNRRTKKYVWVSPLDIAGKNIKLPD